MRLDLRRPATARESILHAGFRLASRRSGAARPHDISGATLDGTGACVAWLAPEMPCGSPPGGRWDATPRPPNPAAAVLGLASLSAAHAAKGGTGQGKGLAWGTTKAAVPILIDLGHVLTKAALLAE
jgi:hypothetical protein